jgi:hypothetical protein
MYDENYADPKVDIESGSPADPSRTRSGRVASQGIATQSPEEVPISPRKFEFPCLSMNEYVQGVLTAQNMRSPLWNCAGRRCVASAWNVF